MRRGMYTGRLYDDDYDFSTVTECCHVLLDGEAKDEEFLQNQRISDIIKCMGCAGCPASQAGIIRI